MKTVSIEKSFSDFVRIHDKKVISDEMDKTIKSLDGILERINSYGPTLAEELKTAYNDVKDDLDIFQKILLKHNMYTIE